MSQVPPKLQEIIDDFSYCVGQEKLEYLLQLAESLPALPDWLQEQSDQMEQVHECMTPVFIFAERNNGTLTFHFDVPPESPTIRGYAAVLKEGLDGSKPDVVTAVPLDFYRQMGLQEVLTGQRLNGISAILAHMQRLASE
ncbi:MAG: SufE family protein [Chloroflexota bacterium]|jgi:cysteine desulfuration protein SufE